jgi:DNA-binding CsgD family transcriptional regulator
MADSIDIIPSGVPKLSARQRELVNLLARGESNKQIARTLGITEGTVKQHLSTLFKKLGINSRSKAVVRAAELYGGNPANPNVAPSPRELPTDYAWRMVSAVALVLRDAIGLTVVEQTRLERALRALRRELSELVAALDGQLLIAPGGDMMVGFGAPRSHIDDAARAVFLARRMAVWLRDQHALKIGIGIATGATIVGFGDEPLYRSEAFDVALSIARATPSGQIHASEVTVKLAGPLFPQRNVTSNSGTNSGQDAERRTGIKLIPTDVDIDPATYVRRAPLPFIEDVLGRARESSTAWLSVSGWPPSASLQLLDAVSMHCESAGLRTYRIRLATDGDPEHVGLNLYRQLKIVARLRERPDGNEIFAASRTHVATAVAAIRVLCMRGPTAIVVYGVDALSMLIKSLGASGIADISSLPLVIAAAGLKSDAEPHVVAKVLSGDPLQTTGAKSYRLPLGPAFETPDGVNTDLATLLDMLTPPARNAVKVFVAQDKSSIITGGNEVGEQIAKELIGVGLFVRREDAIVCRDPTTRGALKRFFVGGGAF